MVQTQSIEVDMIGTATHNASQMGIVATQPQQ
jgi:hypothetical protein